MGKFLESLRLTAIRPSSMEASVHSQGERTSVVELEQEEEEIPFIEVGPHKSMEASASVLATRPLAAGAAPTVMFRPSHSENAPRRSHLTPEIIVHHQPDHPVSAQYRHLLAALIPATSRDSAKALLFAPGQPDATAAVVLLNLAVTAVRQGNTRVVMVDANPGQPSLADQLGLSARPGLGEVLSGAVSLDEAIQKTDWANLTMLPVGAPAAPGLRLVVETPGSLLRKLRQCCDLVLVLGPSLDDGGAALAPACDMVYLVLPEREAFSPRIDELLQTFSRYGSHFGGCILTAQSEPPG